MSNRNRWFTKNSFVQETSVVCALSCCLWKAHEFSLQNCSNIVWSYPTMPTMKRCACDFARYVDIGWVYSADAQHLANPAWHLRTNSVRKDVIFGGVALLTLSMSRSFSSQGLSNTAWTFVRTAFVGQVTRHATDMFFRSSATKPNEQERSNVIWQLFTKLRVSEVLEESTGLAASRNAQRPQSLSITSQSYRVLAQGCWSVARMIVGSFLRVTGQSDPQCAANTS